MSFAFIGTGHICTGRHACTQIHIYQPFSLCVLLFPGGWKSNFLPKDGTRGPSPPGQTALYVQCRCSVLADTDVIWCWAADGETVDVWRKVSFKLERARKLKNQRKSSLCLQEERGMNPDSERYNSFNWRCQRKVRYLWILSDGNIAYGKNKAHIPVSPSRQCVSLQNICIAVLSRPDSTESAPPPSLFFSSSLLFFPSDRLLSLSHSLWSCSCGWKRSLRRCVGRSLSPWRTRNVVLGKECKWSSHHLLEVLSQLWMDFLGFLLLKQKPKTIFSRKNPAEILISENAFEFRKRLIS